MAVIEKIIDEHEELQLVTFMPDIITDGRIAGLIIDPLGGLEYLEDDVFVWMRSAEDAPFDMDALLDREVSKADELPDGRLIIRLEHDKHGQVTKFQGVVRALELVARQCLYGRGAKSSDDIEVSDELIGRLTDILGLWSGLNLEAPIPTQEELDRLGLWIPEHCRNWLPRYITTYCCKLIYQTEDFDGKTAFIPTGMLKARESRFRWLTKKRRESYRTGLFDQGRYGQWENDANKMSYEKAIARAFRKGPLRKWKMTGGLVPSKACTTSTKKNDGAFRKLDKRNDPAVLAMTEHCLRALGQEGHVPATAFVPVNLTDVAIDLGVGEIDSATMLTWRYKGEPLFRHVNLGSGVTLWKISQQWLDDGEWMLAPLG